MQASNAKADGHAAHCQKQGIQCVQRATVQYTQCKTRLLALLRRGGMFSFFQASPRPANRVVPLCNSTMLQKPPLKSSRIPLNPTQDP